MYFGCKEEIDEMKLVIGGYSQGKLNYVLNKNRLMEFCIVDGELPNTEQLQEAKDKGQTVIVNHFHEWMRASIRQGKNAEQEILEFISDAPGCIVISDEIGNGIVPIDSFEREYRERTGRILVKLAEQADEVVRVICGIGQKIK